MLHAPHAAQSAEKGQCFTATDASSVGTIHTVQKPFTLNIIVSFQPYSTDQA